jgi:succinate dehydrogenase flavin-adding protein (antitoxin of CptAB toxin-antitoxin module)
VACNIFRNGNLDEYARKLVREDPKILEWFAKEKKKSKCWKPKELEEKISYYQEKLKRF